MNVLDVKERGRILKILYEDVGKSVDVLVQNLFGQFERRNLVRVAFTAIEGGTYIMKQTVLDVYLKGGFELSPAELSFLREESYELKDTGVAHTRDSKLRTLPNVRFAFKTFARTCFPDFELDVEGKGWQELQEAFKIRNRITHPKKEQDLMVTPDEILVVMSAFVWFVSNYTALTDKFTKILIQALEEGAKSESARAYIKTMKEAFKEEEKILEAIKEDFEGKKKAMDAFLKKEKKRLKRSRGAVKKNSQM